MANSHQRALWPLLRVPKLHRLDTHNQTRYVLPACSGTCQLHIVEFTFAPRDVAKGSGVHGEPYAISEAAAV